jgi:hypothetical protein
VLTLGAPENSIIGTTPRKRRASTTGLQQNCHDLVLISHPEGRCDATEQIKERDAVGSRFAANNSKNNQARPGALVSYTGASSFDGFRNL